MRPTQLTVSAFGPYAKKTVFELGKLGTGGLYLVTGDTGSGKTTLFDAITYALYGEASGDVRDAGMFRSKYADAQTPTFVELEFDYAGKNYLIKRNPDYERPAKRGDGFTLQKANAEFYLPDGRVITKLREVNLAVKELLGVDRGQFTQIAMIAQGEFLKLILASTEERQKIFREIFRTRYYQILQERLKSEAAELGKACDAFKSNIKQQIGGVVCDETNVSKTELEKAQSGELPLCEIEVVIEKIIKQDCTQKNKIEETIEEIETRISEMTRKLGKAEEIEKAKVARTALSKELELKVMRQQAAVLQFEVEKGREAERQTLAESIITLKKELPKYHELDTLQKNLREKRTQLEVLEKKKEEVASYIQKREHLLEAYKLEIGELKNISLTCNELRQEKEKLIEKKKALVDLNKEIALFNELENKLSSEQEHYKKAVAQAIALKMQYDGQYKAYLDEQAGVLAKNLIAGQKCPVCGALEHPEPAALTKEATSKEALEEKKKAVENAERKAAKQSEGAAALKAQIESKKEILRKTTLLLLGECAFEEIEVVFRKVSSSLATRESELLKTLKAVEIKVQRQEILEQEIPKMETLLKEETLQLAEIRESFLLLLAEIKGMKESAEKIKGSLAYSGKEEAEFALSQLESTLLSMKKSQENADRQMQQLSAELKELEGKLIALNEQISNSENADVYALAEQLGQLSALKQQQRAVLSEIAVRLGRNHSALAGIKQQSQTLLETEKKYTWVRALSNTANGNISGKEKVMLETYIQMTYFDRMIVRANTRFMRMSNGQYELQRRMEAENNRSQSGLELDVIDHYNGTRRSVKTLSGGEAFKAALSLALGLSDEIQNSAGGIKLDTMFVDEGFGSLDEESLKQAINTLSGLSEGNRLIGIISHVAELKEKIDRQVVITKEKMGGSRADIIT